MNDLKLFVPFEKQDNDERVVAGYASTEALDSQGEVVKLEALEKALPDYMTFGNIREMHQYSAVGKAVQAKIDMSRRGMYLVAKVVDDMAWKKVKEGVYNGFSIGGRIIKQVNNVIEELSLSEISLVDRPANPEAIFSLVKIADGKEVDSMKKAEDMVEDTEAQGMEHEPVLVAQRLADIASQMVFMIDFSKQRKRDYKHLERILMSLKDAIGTELSLDKREANLQAEAEKQLILSEVRKLEDIIKVTTASSKYNHGWSEKYFDQMQKTL